MGARRSCGGCKACPGLGGRAGGRVQPMGTETRRGAGSWAGFGGTSLAGGTPPAGVQAGWRVPADPRFPGLAQSGCCSLGICTLPVGQRHGGPGTCPRTPTLRPSKVTCWGQTVQEWLQPRVAETPFAAVRAWAGQAVSTDNSCRSWHRKARCWGGFGERALPLVAGCVRIAQVFKVTPSEGRAGGGEQIRGRVQDGTCKGEQLLAGLFLGRKRLISSEPGGSPGSG